MTTSYEFRDKFQCTYRPNVNRLNTGPIHKQVAEFNEIIDIYNETLTRVSLVYDSNEIPVRDSSQHAHNQYADDLRMLLAIAHKLRVYSSFDEITYDDESNVNSIMKYIKQMCEYYQILAM